MFNIEVVGIKYSQRNQYGDFLWMCQQNKYLNSLYIFNDNEEYHNTSRSGAGNAIMRKFNKHSKYEKPISAGIQTGTLNAGGYDKFTKEIKKTIDNAFEEIIELIKLHNYSTIYFSSELNGRLGTSIFTVNSKVIEYITSRIYKLSNNPVKIVKLLSDNIFEDVFEFDNDNTNDTNDNNNDNTNDTNDVDVDVDVDVVSTQD
jgi:hypothetical protein